MESDEGECYEIYKTASILKHSLLYQNRVINNQIETNPFSGERYEIMLYNAFIN